MYARILSLLLLGVKTMFRHVELVRTNSENSKMLHNLPNPERIMSEKMKKCHFMMNHLYLFSKIDIYGNKSH